MSCTWMNKETVTSMCGHIPSHVSGKWAIFPCRVFNWNFSACNDIQRATHESSMRIYRWKPWHTTHNHGRYNKVQLWKAGYVDTNPEILILNSLLVLLGPTSAFNLPCEAVSVCRRMKKCQPDGKFLCKRGMATTMTWTTKGNNTVRSLWL